MREQIHVRATCDRCRTKVNANCFKKKAIRGSSDALRALGWRKVLVVRDHGSFWVWACAECAEVLASEGCTLQRCG